MIGAPGLAAMAAQETGIETMRGKSFRRRHLKDRGCAYPPASPCSLFGCSGSVGAAGG